MHFTYLDDDGPENADSGLRQGDILRITPELAQTLESVHPYYNRNASNRYFIVLTQSCDLVRGRGPSGQCKASHISIAPVRTIEVVLGRLIDQEKQKELSADVPVCANKSRNRIQQFLERLFNNNESDYFYLHKEPTKNLPEDCCAYLRLPIALRAGEHYDTCRSARFLGLSEPFRAKLGWLVGQLFSRVGTQDWEKPNLNQLIRDAINDAAVWVDDRKISELQELASRWIVENPDKAIDADVIDTLLKQVPEKKEKVIERLEEIIRSSRGYNPEDGSVSFSRKQIDVFLRSVKNDPTISAIFK